MPGLTRASFGEIAARPLQAMRSESFVILDLTLPAGLPAGSYFWATVLVSKNLRRVSSVATASFTFQAD